MRSLRGLILATGAAVTLVAGSSARPGSGAADADVRAALLAAQAATVDAARDVAGGDPVAAGARVALARSALEALGPTRPRLRTTLRRLDRARAAIEALAPDDDATPAVLSLRSAAAAVAESLRRLRRRGAAGCTLVERGTRAASIRRPGDRATFVVRGASPDEPASIEVTNDDPLRTAVATEVVARGRGRFRVRWGSDLGAATVRATCGDDASLRAFCTGAPGVLAMRLPSAPDYGAGPRFARVGTALTPQTPSFTGDGPFAFAADPALPEGLSIDGATGTLAGTATTPGAASSFRVTVSNARGAAAADLVVDVDPALPVGVTDLAGGFAVEHVADVAAVPVKMAFAPDGRLFVSELTTGAIRVIEDGALLPDPLVTVPVLRSSPEHGLFGLATAPDFASTGALYVTASSPAGDGKPDRTRILRYVVEGATASGPEVVVDDLPLGATQNGGHLAFGPDGALYATTGDIGDAALAQTDGVLAGRILRIAPDGSAPPDNPIADSLEWCRGFRNPFSFAFQPTTGRLFATENGPAAHDELNFVQPGKNFGWGAPEDAHFGALTGIRVVDWIDVIVPTGIAAHDGTQFGAQYAGDLFVASYDHAHVRRLVLEGIDLRDETTFLQFDEQEFALKPLDLAVAPDGSLWISTFASIWRVRRD